MDEREKERLLLNLESTPNEMDDLVRLLDDDALGWRPIPTRWSVKEIICHLRDVEREVFSGRYAMMFSEEEPYLPRVDQDELAALGDYINQDGVRALADFKRFRNETIAALTDAPLERWLRTGTHWSCGQLSVKDLVAKQCEHDMNHLAQVKDIVGLKMSW